MTVKTWQMVIAPIIITLVLLVGIGIYSWWDGTQEVWHDTGKVSWVSPKYFVTTGPLGLHFAENFTIQTLSHGNFTFTTDIACNTESDYHCQYPYTPNNPHLGDITGLAKHKNGSFDMVFA